MVDGQEGGQMTIDILIELDHYWQLVQQGPEGLVAQKIVFGLVVSGSLSCSDTLGNCMSQQLLCFNDIPKQVVHRFWDLESIGISKSDS